MSTNFIIQKLESIEKMLKQQSLLKKEVLTSREAAIYLGLSLSYLYELVSKKTIPAYKPNGGKLYFKRKELYNWMLSKRKASNSEIKEAATQFSAKMGIKSDCKSLDPSQFVPNNGRN
ncbi:MAG TPA: DNA-binding protein [Prolixibacteraceae bacterium]|jgi:excisionase family DNA binding protein|nr:DNA-binding protein [Prolixibacteraceae bacterium]